MMQLIRHYAALWVVPVVFTSTLHLGLAWGALELGFGPASYTPPQFPVELVTLAAEVPEPVVQPPRPVVPPPRRMVPPPKTPPRRPEPIETVTSPLPAEPTRPPESTATPKPPMTMVEEAPLPPERKIPERQTAASPSPVETSRQAERPSLAEKEAAPPANETRAALEVGPPAPGPAPGRAADVDALSAAATAPAPVPSAPRVAAVPPNGTGSDLGRIARPRGGYQVVPTYPSTARRLGIQGTALLRVFVLDDGRVGEIQVQKSAGHPDLDRAAADAVRRWRFDPARKGNENVSTWVLLPVEFRLTP